MIFVLFACGARPAAAAGSDAIVFFDPDANYEALPRIVQALNQHLAERLPGYTLKATSDVAGLIDTIKSSHAGYAIVGSQYLDNLKAFAAVPLLVCESAGTVYYHKILVDRGTGEPGDLRKKRIAGSAGDRSRSVSSAILQNLKSAGLHVDDALFMPMSKDIDALLALTFRQADAALVTNSSLETLKTVNPAAASSMRSVWTSGDILRPVLVALKANESAGSRDGVVAALTGLKGTASGKTAMQSLGVDSWITYTADMSRKGAE